MSQTRRIDVAAMIEGQSRPAAARLGPAER